MKNKRTHINTFTILLRENSKHFFVDIFVVIYLMINFKIQLTVYLNYKKNKIK